MQHLLNYFRAFELEHNVSFIGARTSDIAHDISSCAFFQRSSISTCWPWIKVFKRLLKNSDVFTVANLWSVRSKHNSDEDLPGFVHVDDANLFPATIEDAKLLFMETDNWTSSSSPSYSSHVQSSYQSGRKVLTAYHNIHDHLMLVRTNNRAEPIFLDFYLNNTSENTAIHMAQGVTILEQYLNVMGFFA